MTVLSLAQYLQQYNTNADIHQHTVAAICSGQLQAPFYMDHRGFDSEHYCIYKMLKTMTWCKGEHTVTYTSQINLGKASNT